MSFDNLPRGWQLIPLEDAMDAIIDYRGKTPKKTESGIPLITAKIVKGGYVLEPFEFIAEDNYDSWMVRGLPQVGDVVLTTEAPLGETAQLTSANVALAQRIVTLRGKKGLLDSDFLLCALQSDFVQHQLESRASGSTVKGIKQSELRKVILPIPPLLEQHKISQVLKSLSNKLVCNTKTNQTLEEMAQAIFKSWFVDFEPVKAKMNGEQPEGMDAATASLFPEKLVESELGLIPDGWEPKQLKDIVELAYGKALKKTDRVAGDVPVYGSGGLTGYHNQSLVEGPGIIVGRKGTVGSVYWEPKAFYPIDTVFYVKPKAGYSLKYCHLVLQNLGLKDMNTDAAVPGLNRNNAYRLDVITPSESVLKKFEEMMQSFQSKVDANNAQNASLESLRDTLLPKLLSGDNVMPFEKLPSSDMFDTQVNFNGKYPDMLWGSDRDNWSVIFEHKVWSELDENQLSNYRSYAQNNLKKPFILVLITAHTSQHKQNPDIALCWHEVAEKISAIESRAC